MSLWHRFSRRGRPPMPRPKPQPRPKKVEKPELRPEDFHYDFQGQGVANIYVYIYRDGNPTNIHFLKESRLGGEGGGWEAPEELLNRAEKKARRWINDYCRAQNWLAKHQPSPREEETSGLIPWSGSFDV